MLCLGVGLSQDPDTYMALKTYYPTTFGIHEKTPTKHMEKGFVVIMECSGIKGCHDYTN